MFTAVTITGTFENADDSPCSGKVFATPNVAMSNDGAEQSTFPICGVLDDTGSLVTRSGDPFVLNSTNDADTLPQEAFYTFTLKIDGQDIMEFDAFVPTTTPQTFISLQENAV